VVTDQVKQHIKDCAQFAPLHNPANLRGIEAAEKLLPKAKQVAVFDTAFHHNLPLPAQTYAIPLELAQKYRIRRYGFHGISNQYCAPRAAQMLGKKPDELWAIICHLGNGCSVTAVQNGTSADTTMGFTPLDGLVMGTRSGAVDPGILIYLLKHAAHSPEALDDLLDRQSGLLGLSGKTSDMREILSACDKGDERAQLAFEVFVHSLSGYIATMFARLDRCDCLVFTGGIGERAAAVRRAACRRLAFAGVSIDDEANEDTPEDVDISASSSRTRVLVIHTQENWMIARATREKLKLS
jgi:acetate kinase